MARNVLRIAILVLASLAPLAAYAQGPTTDVPTQTALTALRTEAATMVVSLSNNKGITGTQVTASYSDQLNDISPPAIQQSHDRQTGG